IGQAHVADQWDGVLAQSALDLGGGSQVWSGVLLEEGFNQCRYGHCAGGLCVERYPGVFARLDKPARFPCSRSSCRKAHCGVGAACDAGALVIAWRGENEGPRLVPLLADAQCQPGCAFVEIVGLSLPASRLAGGDESVSQREAWHEQESPARLVVGPYLKGTPACAQAQ